MADDAPDIGGTVEWEETIVVTRCAWCERYAVAEEWLPEGELDAAVAPGKARVSHGICPECLDGLPRLTERGA